MKELIEEIGMKESLMRNVFGSGIRWTGHTQPLGDETVPKKDRVTQGRLIYEEGDD